MTSHYDILVVDDEQVVIDATTKICSAEGMSVDSALDAQSALTKLRRNTYRLVLCDIKMPDLDGFRVLDIITREKEKTPVIMTTGYTTVDHALRSLNSGAFDFLPKPFTADELVGTVKRGLQLHELLLQIPRSGDAGDATGLPAIVPCPAGYYCLGMLSWASIEKNGIALIGASHLYLKTIGSVGAIQFQAPDAALAQGTTCIEITATDGLVHDLLSPLSGTVVESNAAIQASPSTLEKDPYFAGWLYRIIPTNLEEEMNGLVCCTMDEIQTAGIVKHPRHSDTRHDRSNNGR